jgi:hypothetical protein
LQSKKVKQLRGKLGGSFQPVGEVESVSKELSQTFKKELNYEKKYYFSVNCDRRSSFNLYGSPGLSF